MPTACNAREIDIVIYDQSGKLSQCGTARNDPQHGPAAAEV